MCLCVSLHMFVPTYTGTLGGQNTVLDSLELELQAVKSHDIGAGNRTWVLCKRGVLS